MCGINFIFSDQPVQANTLEQMNRVLAHRGPDHSGVIINQTSSKHFGLSATRLSIIDPSEMANQPFIDDEGNVLVYNGEIYNYLELRGEMAVHGHRFRTSSDTEVLFELLKSKGMDALPLLNGMFAFVFYNANKEEFLIGRDYAGMKPLYYAQNNEGIIFSSEIKGVLASGMVKKELNEKQIPNYLLYKYAVAPETFFRGIHEVLPGETIAVNKDGEISKGTYSYMYDYTPGNTLKGTKKRLQKSVYLQRKSDAALGLLLSGGTDSSLLLALAKDTGFDIPCFTIANDESEIKYGTDDLSQADKMAKHFNVPHQTFVSSYEDLKELSTYVTQLDQPIADSGGFLTWLITKSLKGDVKVLWSGAGADEYFGGYNRHFAYREYLKWIHNNPLSFSAAKLLTYNWSGSDSQKARHYTKFNKDISLNSFTTFDRFVRTSIPTSALLQEVPGNLFRKSESKGRSLLESALNFDRRYYLPYDVLKITDHASMRNSIEVRMPFLDNHLVNYASAVSGKHHLSKGRKWILKELLNDMVPESLISRRKDGFGIPFGEWVKKPEASGLKELVFNKNSLIFQYLDFNQIQKYCSRHFDGKSNQTVELWSLIVLELWLQEHFA